ncbi:hypothetical protein RB195_017963 [Necator americanus]|uniref:7TM GPCR serpentine receptor class x (Srx) domain-containing protein n=1 Tax=Necator americanus TaxID=51031 RepID=A0ABR1C993_NECAM
MLLRYLCVPLAALQETRMRDRPVTSIEDYTICCGDADEKNVGSCATAVRNDYNKLVEDFSPTSSRCALAQLRNPRGRNLWIVFPHAPTQTAVENTKDAFYIEINALVSEISNQPLPNQLQWMNLRVGQLSLFFVETAFHCCLFISFNRFVAITYPLQYRKMFTGRTTLSIIIFISLVSALYWSIYFKHGCDFFFDHQYRVWAFGLESCSVWLSFYIDMSYNVCLFLVVGFIDIVTLLQLRSLAKNIQSRRLNISSNQNKGMPRRQKKELVFFLQAFTNSCIYAFMLICFHLLSRVVTTNFELFLCTTFIWGFSHATGGVILVVFNPEIRRNLLALRNITNSLHDPATVTSVRPYPATVATRTKC